MTHSGFRSSCFLFRFHSAPSLKPTCLRTTIRNSHGPFWPTLPSMTHSLSSLVSLAPAFCPTVCLFVFCCLFSHDLILPALPACLSAAIPCQDRKSTRL